MSIFNLPEQPWFWQDTKERAILHPPPGPVDPHHLARMQHAEKLAAEVIAQLDEKLAHAARQAHYANIAAGPPLNAALAELAALDAEGADDGLDDAQVEAQAMRRVVLERQIPALQKRLAKSQQAAEQAIAAARFELRVKADQGVLERERRRLHDLRVQVEQLEQQIGDGELAIEQARSIIGRWLPKGDGNG
jgi:hypothetical protein